MERRTTRAEPRSRSHYLFLVVAGDIASLRSVAAAAKAARGGQKKDSAFEQPTITKAPVTPAVAEPESGVAHE